MLPVKENRKALFDALDAQPWPQVPVAVIGTLWSRSDLSTALLMTGFYHYHRNGGDPGSPMPGLPGRSAWRSAG